MASAYTEEVINGTNKLQQDAGEAADACHKILQTLPKRKRSMRPASSKIQRFDTIIRVLRDFGFYGRGSVGFLCSLGCPWSKDLLCFLFQLPTWKPSNAFLLGLIAEFVQIVTRHIHKPEAMICKRPSLHAVNTARLQSRFKSEPCLSLIRPFRFITSISQVPYLQIVWVQLVYIVWVQCSVSLCPMLSHFPEARASTGIWAVFGMCILVCLVLHVSHACD
jgi:hypothetical protein